MVKRERWDLGHVVAQARARQTTGETIESHDRRDGVEARGKRIDAGTERIGRRKLVKLLPVTE